MVKRLTILYLLDDNDSYEWVILQGQKSFVETVLVSLQNVICLAYWELSKKLIIVVRIRFINWYRQVFNKNFIVYK